MIELIAHLSGFLIVNKALDKAVNGGKMHMAFETHEDRLAI